MFWDTESPTHGLDVCNEVMVRVGEEPVGRGETLRGHLRHTKKSGGSGLNTTAGMVLICLTCLRIAVESAVTERI